MLLEQQRMKGQPVKFRPQRYSNPDLYDTGAVLYPLGYQANWELVIMAVCHKPVDRGYMPF